MTQTSPTESIYDIKINSLAGQPINLSDYKGKYILFVNVASKCGFTGQYEDLLHFDGKRCQITLRQVNVNKPK